MDDVGERPPGRVLPGWTPRPAPPLQILTGRAARVEPFDVARHAEALFDGFAAGGSATWEYMPYGPFADVAAYRAFAEREMTGADPLFFTLFDRAKGAPGGVAALMRITPQHGVVEVGSIAYAPWFRRSTAATEAMFLLAGFVFDVLGYRRYEWKCDDLNAPSKRAARRLGFRFEGVFRNHMVVKGRNRDTAWFSITAEEWPARRATFERWLDPSNFDDAGRQKMSLGSLMGATER